MPRFTGAFVGVVAHDLTGQGWTADVTRFRYAPVMSAPCRGFDHILIAGRYARHKGARSEGRPDGR